MEMLAQSLRPKSLTELYGQSHVVDVLQAAARRQELDNYRVLLFVGPRGCGKTSTARIMAKMYNCLDDEFVKLHGEPCGVCANCKNLSTEDAFHGCVREVDGGAGGKMDVIMDILDTCQYPPIGTFKKRVFILDEAHQLSSNAKSALLKTMEEPPPYVAFILATTEGDKVPIPIQSRCQVFQFRLASPEVIADYLSAAVDNYGYSADREALLKLGELSGGSFRDSAQLLTKALTVVNEDRHLSIKTLESGLGLPSTQHVKELARCVVIKNPKGALNTLKTALVSGVDPEKLVASVSDFIADWAISGISAGTDVKNGWTYTKLLDLAQHIRSTAARYNGTNFGGLGASIALVLACLEEDTP